MLRIGSKIKKSRKFSVQTFATLSQATDFDVAVIGGGPGGYVAAIKASQLGLKTVCIEKRETLGGTCLNVGCIPSKSLLHATHLYHQAKHGLSKYGITVENCKADITEMQKNKEQSVLSLAKGIEMLFRKNKVDLIQGTASFTGENANSLSIQTSKGERKTITAANIIIATGSSSRSLPGVEIDEKNVLSSTGALSLKSVPERFVVVGAGVTGIELGTVWGRLGAKVTVIEYFDRIIPSLDSEIAQSFTKILKGQKMKFLFGKSVLSAMSNGKNGVRLKVSDNKTKKVEEMDFDKALITVGRKANFDGLNLDKIGIKTEKNMIKTDADLRTNLPNVFAIGDVTDGPQLAHKAEEEGIAVAETIAEVPAHINYGAIPGVIYTNPEVASVGKTEDQLKNANVEFSSGKFPFLANSRAKTVDDYEGFVKILADKKSGKVLGMHIIGEQAGELIQEGVMAINYGGSAEDIARTCHAHPTRVEAVKEAAMAANDKAIHL